MNEYLYEIPSLFIALGLLVSMLLAMELGYRIGLHRKEVTSEVSKEHINAIQGSILGILALLIGFTFSLSLQRYDTRTDAVIEEANAISTAYMRIQLLPEALQKAARDTMREYIDLRVITSHLAMTNNEEGKNQLARTAEVQAKLWDYARQGIEVDPNMYPPTMFAESVNGLIEHFRTRNAALDNHVPELVLLLLHGTLLMSGAIVGFSTGVAGHRPSLVTHVMVLLIVVLVFIIIDLDRPRRGLIRVSQASLIELQSSIHAQMDAISTQTVPKASPVPIKN